MYVLSLESTDTPREVIATADAIVDARCHAVSTLREILKEIGVEGEYKTVRLPQYEHDGQEVFANIHVDESVDNDWPLMADWVNITDVPEVDKR